MQKVNNGSFQRTTLFSSIQVTTTLFRLAVTKQSTSSAVGNNHFAIFELLKVTRSAPINHTFTTHSYLHINKQQPQSNTKSKIANMPTTFTSLPREIRDLILREHLSVENNWGWEEKRNLRSESLEWKVPAQTFTANKQLSIEALEAFHEENTLVSVSATDCRFLRYRVSRVIPLIIREERFPDTALHIHLTHGSKTKESKQKKCKTRGWCRGDYHHVVFAARYLPRFIQLINAVYSSSLDKDTLSI